MPPSPPTRVGSRRTCWAGRPWARRDRPALTASRRARADDELDRRCSPRSGPASARSASGSGSRASPWRTRWGRRSGTGCHRHRPASCRGATSRSWRARARPGARRGRLARLVASIDRSDLLAEGGGRWRNGRPGRGLGGTVASGRRRALRPARSAPGARPEGSQGFPATSRRRGPRRIAPPRRPLARRSGANSPILPGEYPCVAARTAPTGPTGVAAPVDAGLAETRPQPAPASASFDTPFGPTHNPRDDDAPCALRAPGAFACL